MSDITIVGLGPSGDDGLSEEARRLLLDGDAVVILRTMRHPAAAAVAAERQVESCDDLYEAAGELGDVYDAIADRVLANAPGVVFAVPGSPLVAERSVLAVRRKAAGVGRSVSVLPATSFFDLALDRLGLDVMDRGVQVLNGRELPVHVALWLPTVIAHVDTQLVLGDVTTMLGRTLPPETPVTVLRDLGGDDELVSTVELADLLGVETDQRTTLFVDPPPNGWTGLVATNARLRRDCPWDASRTHHTLVPHLIEEAYELADALLALPAEAPAGQLDAPGYAEVEAELGDVLLQVVFHANLAAEAAGFGVEEVAEMIRRKLVFRHPHVFGDVDADTAAAVESNWDRLKREERGGGSALDGIPSAMPALMRAAKVQRRAAGVGFDWPDVSGILDKVAEEASELAAENERERQTDELGDLLFAVVNLARRMDVDPEGALRRATERFDRRFRAMEEAGPLEGLTLQELDERWEAAKAAER